MTNGKMIVGVYAVVVIVLFFVSCFLMSIVNPPPLSALNNKTIRNNSKVYARMGQNTNTYHGREFPDVDKADYGIEKVNDYQSSDDSNQTTLEPSYLRHRNVVHVVPPLWPPTTPDAQNINITETNNEIFNITTSICSPIKGRRSLNNIERTIVNKNKGSLVLKIVGDDGQSRVEIKLGADKPVENIRSRENKRQNKMNYIFYTPDIKNETQLTKDTVIKIMPNDTLIFEDGNLKFTEIADENNALHKQNEIDFTTEKKPFTSTTDPPIKIVKNDTEINSTPNVEDIFIKANVYKNMETDTTVNSTYNLIDLIDANISEDKVNSTHSLAEVLLKPNIHEVMVNNTEINKKYHAEDVLIKENTNENMKNTIYYFADVSTKVDLNENAEDYTEVNTHYSEDPIKGNNVSDESFETYVNTEKYTLQGVLNNETKMYKR